MNKLTKSFALTALILTATLSALTSLTAAPKSAEQELRVALTGKYPPFSFYSSEGKLVGFDVDVSRLIAESAGLSLEITTTEWDGILAGLIADKYDAIIGSMAVTPERKKRVLFSEPYYVSGAQLFIRQSETNLYSSISDLDDKVIGVGLGETYEHFIRSKHPEIKVQAYKSTVDIFQDMQNGRLDAFCTDRLVGLYQIQKGDMPFVPAGALLYRENIAIPVSPHNKNLLKKINGALDTINSNGELDRLHLKWFGAQSHNTNSSDNSMSWKTEAKMLLRGFSITLLVATTSLTIGFALALPWGIALNNLSGKKFRLLMISLRFVNDFVRGTPLLIQLFFVYFGAPQIGITLSPVASAILTMSINCAAYMAEAVRSGLMSVPDGQRLAGKALGLTWIQIFIHVVWPQAFRVSIPPLMNIVVAFIKDTALISVIAVAEVIREAQSIISVTYNPLKYYFIVAIMFFLVTFPLMKIAGRVEQIIRRKGFTHD